MIKSEIVVKLYGRKCRCKEFDECIIIMIKENLFVCDIFMIMILICVLDVGFGMKRIMKLMVGMMFFFYMYL